VAWEVVWEAAWAVAMVEEEASVVVAQEVVAFMATEEMAASPRARIARLAALAAAAAVVVAGACPMWDVVRASTSKRPPTST